MKEHWEQLGFIDNKDGGRSTTADSWQKANAKQADRIRNHYSRHGGRPMPQTEWLD